MPEYSITENEMCEIIECISEGYIIEELYAGEIMYIKMCNKKRRPSDSMTVFAALALNSYEFCHPHLQAYSRKPQLRQILLPW